MKFIGFCSEAGDDLSCFFGPSSRDNCNEPFHVLQRECEARGYRIVPLRTGQLRDCEHVVFWDAHGFDNSFIRHVKSRCTRGRVGLVLWEPPSVRADNWNQEFHAPFDRILTWNDSLVDNIRYFKFHVAGIGTNPAVMRVPFEQKKMLVNISMHKFSPYRYELYSARRRSIQYFEKHASSDFDLYGHGWNPRLSLKLLLRVLFRRRLDLLRHYSSYRGAIANKWDVLPKYKFALCYENASDQVGCVTEKIFDYMRGDCIPIYWGAPNVTSYVDSAAFIDRRQFESDSSLHGYIKAVSSTEYEVYRNAISRYLAGPKFQMFLPPYFASSFLRFLGIV